jgi:hypothetical protein
MNDLEVMQRCESLIKDISTNDIALLTNFAEYRLMGLGRSFADGEDITQSALMAVMQGLEADKLGRHPRQQDVTNKDEFLKYLKGVIISLIQCETKTRKIKSYHQHIPIVDATGVTEEQGGIYLATNLPNPAEQAARDDEQDQLFAKLRQRIPQRLHRTLEQWEEVFQESDVIPVDRFRKHRVELRRIAREFFQELQTG